MAMRSLHNRNAEVLIAFAFIFVACGKTVRVSSTPQPDGSSGNPSSDAEQSAQQVVDFQPAQRTDAGSKDSGFGDTGVTESFSVQSYDEFCRKRSEIHCRMLSRCCGSADINLELCTRWKRSYFSKQTQASCVRGAEEPETFDSESANQCLILFRNSIDGCHFVRLDTPARRDAPRICERVAPVALPGPGENCSIDGSPQTPCSSPPGTYSGCIPMDDTPAVCSSSLRKLMQGEYCDDSNYQHLSATDICEDGLVCRMIDFTCGPLAADGEPCLSGADCASGNCVDDADQNIARCLDIPVPVPTHECEDLVHVSRWGLYIEHASDLWVNAQDLIWRNTKGLFRAPKDGTGTVTQISGFTTGYDNIVFDQTHFFATKSTGSTITESTDTAIVEFDLETGSRSEIEIDVIPEALAANDQFVYAAGQGCTSLVRLSKANSDIERLQLEDAPPEPPLIGIKDAWLVTDPFDVYCASTAAIYRYSAVDNEPGRLIYTFEETDSQTSLYIYQMYLVGDRIWIRINRDSAGSIKSLSRDGGTLRDEVEVSNYILGRFAFDRIENRLYYASEEGIFNWSIDQNRLEVLEAKPISQGNPITVDSEFVYWTNGSVILRRAK